MEADRGFHYVQMREKLLPNQPSINLFHTPVIKAAAPEFQLHQGAGKLIA